MRVGRLKRLRRALRFFRVACGFREPFKVLLDGNFVHACYTLGLATTADELALLLAKPLAADVRLFTTKDAGRELDGLGPEYAESAKLVRSIQLLRNTPDEKESDKQRQRKRKRYVSARASIERAVANGNTEKVFVATQDAALRGTLKKDGAPIPLIWVSQAGIHMEQPSEAQQQFVDEHKRALSDVPEHEKPAGLESQNSVLSIGRTSARFRQKRAKGPNPLSCKPPSKYRKDTDGSSEGIAGVDDGVNAAAHAPKGATMQADANASKRRRPRRKSKARREVEHSGTAQQS